MILKLEVRKEANDSRRVPDLYQTKCTVENKLEEYGSTTRREHRAKEMSVVQKKRKSEV